MGDITISTAWGWILAAAAAIVAISKAWEILKPKFHPELELRKKMSVCETLLANDDLRIKKLEQYRENSKEFQGVMCRVMLAQLNHELSGNDIEYLRNARDELNEYLTNNR